jgi:hypothetical protein
MSEEFDELIAELEASDKPDRRLAAELLAMKAELARLQAVEAALRESQETCQDVVRYVAGGFDIGPNLMEKLRGTITKTAALLDRKP